MEELNVIQIGIVAPTRAYRAGLRALIHTAPKSVPGAVLDVYYDSASLNDIAVYFDELEVLILEESEGALSDLHRLLLDNDIPLGVIFLSDDPKFASQVANMPIQGWGVLGLDCSSAELIATIFAVHEGLITAHPSLLLPSLKSYSDDSADLIDPTMETLTERESQVLQLVATGQANKQIALHLGISEHTVKFHISSIYTKLRVTNRTEAVRTGIKFGLITF